MLNFTIYFWIKDSLFCYLEADYVIAMTFCFFCAYFTHQVSLEIIPERFISYSINDGA